jgi:hypothetical protein
MPKAKKTTSKVEEEPTDEELNKVEEETKDKPGKIEKNVFYAVFDNDGKYVRAYADKKLADLFVVKSTNKGKKVEKITKEEKEGYDEEVRLEMERIGAERTKLMKEGHLPIVIH